ncbi:MAG: hypothetical protein ACRDT6_09070 [Micromonosporaceae bacterium]
MTDLKWVVTTVAAAQPPDDYIAEELLWCLVCSRQTVPAPRVDGSRFYACGLDCPQADLPAIPVEQDLMLPALVRAYVALYGVGRTGEPLPDEGAATAAIAVSFTGATPWRPDDEPVVSAAEQQRWQHTDPSDHRAMLLAAYVRVTVDAAGTVTPVWRHAEEAVASQATGTTSQC